MPPPAVRNPVEAAVVAVPRRADDAQVGQAFGMTEPTAPQPRDIALEQETPEQAAELEAQSEPATTESAGES